MPKVTKVGSFRAKAAADRENSKIDAKNADSTETAASDNNLSRGQRKRLAKREQYLKREQMILSSLKLARQVQQSKQIDGVDALYEALSTVQHTTEKPASIPTSSSSTSNTNPRNNQQKQAIAVQEVNHLNLVLQHPAFQSNPFAAIQNHLKNSLADQAQQNASDYAQKQIQQDKLLDKKKHERKTRLAEHKATKQHPIRSRSRRR